MRVLGIFMLSSADLVCVIRWCRCKVHWLYMDVKKVRSAKTWGNVFATKHSPYNRAGVHPHIQPKQLRGPLFHCSNFHKALQVTGLGKNAVLSWWFQIIWKIGSSIFDHFIQAENWKKKPSKPPPKKVSDFWFVWSPSQKIISAKFRNLREIQLAENHHSWCHQPGLRRWWCWCLWLIPQKTNSEGFYPLKINGFQGGGAVSFREL